MTLSNALLVNLLAGPDNQRANVVQTVLHPERINAQLLNFVDCLSLWNINPEHMRNEQRYHDAETQSNLRFNGHNAIPLAGRKGSLAHAREEHLPSRYRPGLPAAPTRFHARTARDAHPPERPSPWRIWASFFTACTPPNCAVDLKRQSNRGLSETVPSMRRNPPAPRLRS